MKAIVRHKRILEQINKWDLLDNFCQKVQVQYPPKEDYPQLIGQVFVITEDNFDKLLDQIVEFTYHETFNLIKRKVGTDD